MRKILCPTDFSSQAINATLYAAKFAQATNSELIIFHVESIFKLTPMELLRGKGMTVAALNDQLEVQSQEITTSFKISCYADVELSGHSLPSVIDEKADAFDLILMGTHGMSDYFDFFMGSDTYKVIKQTSTPVLLIPVTCEYSPISKIIFATDILKGEYFPLRKLVDWAKLLESKVRILQVVPGHYKHETEVDLKRTQTEISDFYENEIALEFDTIWSQEIGNSIHSYVLRTESDALALCTRSYGIIEGLFHKSVTKLISSIAEYPVFVFH